jgi:hypothetical protein
MTMTAMTTTAEETLSSEEGPMSRLRGSHDGGEDDGGDDGGDDG